MKITKFYSFLLVSLLAVQIHSLNAQVVINEFSCSNLSQFVDDHSDYGDWIELYNTSASSVNLGGYYLSDDSINSMKWQFPAGVTIGGNGFLRIWASGRNQMFLPYHANFTLKQTKNSNEWVILSNSSGSWVDSKEIQQKTQLGHSYGRIPNGAGSWAIFTSPTPNSSNNVSIPYVDYADKPDFSLTPGFYTSSQTLIITTTEPNANIYYTQDGSLPTAASQVYLSPITISSTKVIKAITLSADPDILPSFLEFNTYFMNVSHTVPVVSIAASQLPDLANDIDESLIPKGSFEYFNTAQLRTANTYGEFNKHGQDSWANSQRSLDFISRDEMGYNHAVEEQLFQTSPMDNYQRVILRAAGDDNYPADHHPANDGSAHVRDAYVHNLALSGNLNIDARRGAKCVVYLNGTYWGVYDLRDNPDNHDNTEYYYGQDKYHLYMLKIWGNSWAEYGGNAAFSDWQSLHDYILANNMANPASYQYVTDRLDVTSLVDYVLVNMFTVCSDWLNWNTCWWRGLDSTGTHLKWGYQLWDNDATFGHYINYTGIPNTTPSADPCDPETINFSYPKDHIDLLLQLRQNPDFNQYYISRQHDLWNTTFKCDNMLYQFDSTVAVIDPEMTAHANRWFGTYTEWTQNVQDLRDFITQRCTAIVPGWLSCYGLNGPYDITVDADPAGAGSVKLNSLTHSNLPWSGQYFGGINSNLEALPNANYQFVSWTSNNQVFNPNSTAIQATVNLTSSDSIVAHFMTTGVPELLPAHTPVVSVYPSLTNDEVTIQYSLSEAEQVSLRLYSVVGNEIAEINTPGLKIIPGNHIVKISLANSNLSAGLYILEFATGTYKQSVKLVYSPY